MSMSLPCFRLCFTLAQLAILIVFCKANAQSENSKSKLILQQNFQSPHDYDSFFPSLFSDLKARSDEQIQNNRLNRYFTRQDKRGYFFTSYNSYQKELDKSESEDAKKRIGNFLNRWLLTSINEKYPIFKGRWKKNGQHFEVDHEANSFLDEEQDQFNNKLSTEASYRIRTDRTEIELKNDILTLVGKAYYNGKHEAVVKKYFDGLGLEAIYVMRPSQNIGNEFVLEKSLHYHMKAKTTYGKEVRYEGASPIAGAKFELLFHENF